MSLALQRGVRGGEGAAERERERERVPGVEKMSPNKLASFLRPTDIVDPPVLPPPQKKKKTFLNSQLLLVLHSTNYSDI